MIRIWSVQMKENRTGKKGMEVREGLRIAIQEA